MTTISELITELEEMKRQHGDLNIQLRGFPNADIVVLHWIWEGHDEEGFQLCPIKGA